MRWLKMTLLLVPAALFAFMATDVGATSGTGKCKTYFSDSGQIPDELIGYFRRANYDAVEVCLDYQFPAHTSYQAKSEVLRAHDDVCVFEEIYVFLDAKGTWQYRPEKPLLIPTDGVQTFMTRAKGNCPRQDSDTYIRVSDVPVGAFADIVARWQEILESEDRMSAFGRVFYDPVMGNPRNRWLIERLAADIDSLDSTRYLASINGISLQSNGLRYLPTFSLMFQANDRFWSASFDYFNGKVEVVGVGQVEF